MRGMYRSFKWSMAYIVPRGAKADKVDENLRSKQVWDVRRAIQTLRTTGKLEKTPLWLQSQKDLSTVALFASLYEPEIARLDLYDLPYKFTKESSMGVSMQQVVAMSVQNSQVILYENEKRDWDYAKKVSEKLKWERSLQIRKPPEPPKEKK